uniref:Tyr recombinase domain-containing protein n=1 Tax=Plectus sambesii TaxID=2011161 RepID=A0A914WPE2_9BILA
MQGGETVDPTTLVPLFLAEKFAQTGGRGATETAQAALIWYFDMMCTTPNPARAIHAKAVVEGARRLAPAPVHREKVTVEEVRLICRSFTGPSTSLLDHRIGTLLSIMFSAYLRVSEGIALMKEDIKVDADQMMITIRTSKTDQYGQSEHRPIRRSKDSSSSSDSFCPVANMESWLERVPESRFVFPNLSSVSKRATTHMSDDNVRAELRRVLAACGITRKLTTHSFRGGAATTATEIGVPERAVMAAGRWKSVGGFQPYVAVSTATLQGADALL